MVWEEGVFLLLRIVLIFLERIWYGGGYVCFLWEGSLEFVWRPTICFLGLVNLWDHLFLRPWLPTVAIHIFLFSSIQLFCFFIFLLWSSWTLFLLLALCIFIFRDWGVLIFSRGWRAPERKWEFLFRNYLFWVITNNRMISGGEINRSCLLRNILSPALIARLRFVFFGKDNEK